MLKIAYRLIFSLLPILCMLLFSAMRYPIDKDEMATGIISGTVKTSDGSPAAYVSIGLKGLNRGTITSESGTYQLRGIREGTYTLKITYIGLEPQEMPVTVMANKSVTVDFILAETSAKLEEVVVNGYKTVNHKKVSVGKSGIDPMDLPQSMTIISSEVIADQQANRLSDVLKNVNGIAMGSTRGTTGENFFARGYSLGANNYIKNGSRTNSGSLPEASTLESIEILKGSAALLYGNVSGGAVINMVTKKPKFEHGGEISMRAGSYDFYKPTADIYGPITKDIAFRVIGTYENAKSFRNNVSSNRYYVNPSLLYNIGAQTSLLVQGDYLDYNLNPDFGIGSLDGKIPTNIPRSNYYNTPWAFNNGKQSTASAELNHQLNEAWKVNFIGSYQSFNRDYFSTERIQASAIGDWDRKLTRSRTAEDYYTGQLNLTGDFNTGAMKHTFLVGVDADRYMNLSNEFNVSKSAVYDKINLLDPQKYTPRIDIPDNIITGNTKTPTNRAGIYAQDLVSLSEKFKVLAGLRYSYQEIGIPNIFDATTGETTKSKTTARYEKAFSPRLGIVYQPTGTTSLFASYSNNFTPNNGTDVYLNNLKASIIDQFEVGVKNDLFNGRITANVSLYKIINHDFVQTATFDKDGLENANTNLKTFGGETTSDGAELDLSGTIIPGLNFLAGYSYNFMRYTKTSGEKYSNLAGERLVGNTAHTGNGTLFYTFNSGTVKGLKLGASAFYTGKRNAGWNNTVGQTQEGSRLIPVGGFTTFDFSAGYNFRQFSLLTKVSNIGDALNYYVHENYSVNPIPPRQFTTTLAYRF
ncbi:MAG: TonB-dependent siderophore receptor [Sphingobacteriaceae bacterium]